MRCAFARKDFAKGEAWVLDTELLSKMEKTTLESGRASSALSKAIEAQWGIVPRRSEKEENRGEVPLFSGFYTS